MKVFQIISHPVILVASFLFILISGEHYGGFYLLYLLLALPHGGIHAVLGVTGVMVIIASYIKFRRENKYVIEAIVNILGEGLMIASLLLFFTLDGSEYNAGTFEQPIPQLTIVVFGILVVLFALYNILRTISGKIADKSMRVV